MNAHDMDGNGFLLDLDGVTWIGSALAPGAREFWDYCRTHQIPVAFVSNASAASRRHLHAKLERLGLAGVDDAQIFPATRAAALYVTAHKPHARVVLVGEAGLAEELTGAGAVLVDPEQDDFLTVDYVVVGADRQLTYAKLERACDAVLAGAELVTTNGDGNYPTERGLKPAAGPFAAFIAAATGRPVKVVGKPEAELLNQALAYMKLEPGQAVMVGDTPEADLVAAQRAGTRSVLIGDPAHNTTGVEPDWVCRDLGELLKIVQKEHRADT